MSGKYQGIFSYIYILIVSPFSRIYIYIYILENGETIREKSGNLFHQIEWAPCLITVLI